MSHKSQHIYLHWNAIHFPSIKCTLWINFSGKEYPMKHYVHKFTQNI